MTWAVHMLRSPAGDVAQLVCDGVHRGELDVDEATARRIVAMLDAPPGEVTQTARGFNVYAEFEDAYGRRVRVQQSSAWGMAHLWIFTSEADGSEVRHWKAGGGWERLPKPGAAGVDARGIMAEGWSSVSPHLAPEHCRTLIAALQAHLDTVEREGLAADDDPQEREDEA